MFTSQMVLLGFYCDCSLLPPPVMSQKICLSTCKQALWVKVRTLWGKKERLKQEKEERPTEKSSLPQSEFESMDSIS